MRVKYRPVWPQSIAILFATLFSANLIYASGFDPHEFMVQDDLEAWFYGDDEFFSARPNEGQLEFIDPQQAADALHSSNTLTLSEDSLDTGWVTIEQCYQQLDAVADSQIAYQYRAIRDLQISAYSGIEKIWLDGPSVQLKNVDKGASLCLRLSAQVLHQQPDNSFTLISGPYHRQFLDGYYPVHLTFSVNYPADRLRFVSMRPEPQKGLILAKYAENVTFDTYFEGMLTVHMQFEEID